jgi:hypothetical protein
MRMGLIGKAMLARRASGTYPSFMAKVVDKRPN